ncbi:MAG: hypothetical protein IPQ02_15085 [Saprospiraceae bacterium]|nr:hypothetical protein [Candidatus Defluviibacterium haderslevense]
MCTELLPPPVPKLRIDHQSDTSIYYRSEIMNDTLISTTFKTNKAYLAALSAYKWPLNHRDLKVSFLDGDTNIHKRVMETAKKWEQYCGIRFIFGNFPDADITISFFYTGSWSYFGTYSQKMKPSMNFGWLLRDTPQEEYDRVVLHEFGHAIGFVHEHQNPNGNIQWNKERVYQYYMSPPNNWDKLDVDENIFYKYNFNEVNATAFDPKSIMIYAIPAELTLNGYSTSANNNLSPTDINYVSTLYPQR